jgi:hypothetical protein
MSVRADRILCPRFRLRVSRTNFPHGGTRFGCASSGSAAVKTEQSSFSVLDSMKLIQDTAEDDGQSIYIRPF